MSSEAERVFSATKKTIHQGRWSLEANTIKALECLKSWFQAGYYTEADLDEALRQNAAAEQPKLDNMKQDTYVTSDYGIGISKNESTREQEYQNKRERAQERGQESEELARERVYKSKSRHKSESTRAGAREQEHESEGTRARARERGARFFS
ncbi:hypothetical protein MMC07_006767 [Pseudocyphellaria aurata]|nr:hypothetical protein [Pseudocyphellaria aurata]